MKLELRKIHIEVLKNDDKEYPITLLVKGRDNQGDRYKVIEANLTGLDSVLFLGEDVGVIIDREDEGNDNN